jgi:hypothetical protein
MIIPLKNIPGEIIGFDFTGEVTKKDYESVIYPALEEHIKGNKRVKLLCQFDESLKKFDLGALWDDAKMSFKHLLDWKKVAIVSDITWLNDSLKTLGFLMPGRLKIFQNAERDKALEWLAVD